MSQLALLCRKPGGWHESRVRSALPDDVRRWIDDADAAGRGQALRVLRDVASESGWGPAVAAVSSIVGAGGSMDRATASILAASEANGRGVVAYDEPVDMAAYDDVFATMGGPRA